MNTLITKLNAAGYKNTNTNRERAVRNLNLLLDSGILDIELVNADAYNDLENGRAFWYDAKDGYKRCTAYKVTLYGKTYYGHFMPKRRKHRYNAGIISEEVVNNYYLEITDIQLRVAKLISIIKGTGDFLKPEFMAAKGSCSCGKCNGAGIIPAFAYYANGVCFDCGGSGIDRATLKMYIETSIKNA